MSGYTRPPIAAPTYVDRAGREFRYGEHWRGTDGPAEWAYSHDSHPERFAALHEVADALVAHLIATYDVEADADPPVDDVARRMKGGVVRAVRLVPASPHATALTVAWTGYPGLVVRAGELYDEPWPRCGCDACDDDPAGLAEAVEDAVFAVVEGRFREWVTPPTREVGHEIVGPDDRRGASWGPREDLPPARLREVASRLRALPDGRWQPWPRRTAGA